MERKAFTFQDPARERAATSLANLPSELGDFAGIRAALALWMFFNRPLGMGTRWSYAEDFSDGSEFIRFLARDSTRLIDLCQEVVQLPGVTEFERRVMLAAIDAHERHGAAQTADSDARGPLETRKQGRLMVARCLNVRLKDIQYRATLRNLSNGGAMVSGLWGLSTAHKLSLELRPRRWVGGTVRWAIDDRCGIALD